MLKAIGSLGVVVRGGWLLVILCTFRITLGTQLNKALNVLNYCNDLLRNRNDLVYQLSTFGGIIFVYLSTLIRFRCLLLIQIQNVPCHTFRPTDLVHSTRCLTL